MSRPTLIAALLLSHATAAWAGPAIVIPTAERYNVGEWSFCDVHILAKTWGMDEANASARISQKASAGQGPAIKEQLVAARARIVPDGWSTCPYYEAGFSYNDAEALAGVWGGTVEEAKARIEGKLIQHMESAVRATLATRPPPPAEPGRVAVPTGYNSCDAQVLAAHWGTTPAVAAESMKSKVAGGYSALLTQVMTEARAAKGDDTSICHFWEQETYTYDDAEKLAALWKVDVSEAKARVEMAARKGELRRINKALKRN